jgi:thiamine-phosphate pyrophosphorylase
MPRVDFPLYLITDRHQTLGRPLLTPVRQALGVGVRAVQLREKDLGTRALMDLASELLGLIRERGALMLVNDRVDLVLALGADGVHLRSDSMPVSIARRLLGPERLIGASAHSAEAVRRAEVEGADFAVLGPVYQTASKGSYGAPIGLRPIEEAGRRCRIPVFAIGGITPARIREVRRAGAFGVAVISSILSAADVESATRQLLAGLASSQSETP